jgi:hypothetical protein
MLAVGPLAIGTAEAGCAGLVVGAGSYLAAPKGCADPPICSNRGLLVYYVCISDANFDTQTSAYGAFDVGPARPGAGPGSLPANGTLCPPHSFQVITGTGG